MEASENNFDARLRRRSQGMSALRNSWVLAIASVLAAWAGTLALRTVVPDRPLSFVLFFGAVALSAGLGGLWAGVLATILSALTCDYFFLAPLHSFAVAASDLPLMVLFIAAALLINGLSGRLQAQTRQADQRYYQLVQGLDGIVWEINPRTMRFTFVSRRAELLLGYPVSDWLSDPDFRSRCIHPADSARMTEFWEGSVKKGGEHTADYRALTRDGREIWIRETIYVGHDAHGRPMRITGLGIDITDRKAEAEDLTRMKDEFAVLNRVSAALSASLELPDFLTILRSQLAQHLDVEAGCLFLAGDAGDDLRLVDSWGVPAEQAGQWQTRLAAPFSHAHPIAEMDSDLDQRNVFSIRSVPLPDAAVSSPWHDALAIPLLAKDDLRGALLLCTRIPARLDGGRAAFYATLGRQIGALLQNVALYQEVREGREHLQTLSRQLVNVQESERRAIARELHDEIGQVLTGLKLTLEMSARLSPDNVAEPLQKALGLTQDLIRQVEGLSLDLRPAMLDDLGLLPALEWHCRRYTTLTGLGVDLEHTGVGRRFPTEVEITAYRIIQEALTNVARHAGVNRVSVRLWANREILGIQVADAGRGFDLTAVSADQLTGGMTGIQERATLLNGYVTVETAPGMGTSINVELPLTCAAAHSLADGNALLTVHK